MQTYNSFYNTQISNGRERHKNAKNMQRARLIDSRQYGQFQVVVSLVPRLEREREREPGREKNKKRDPGNRDRVLWPGCSKADLLKPGLA